MSNGFGFMFNVFPFIFGIMFIFVFGMIIFTIIKGITTWNKNNHSPVLTVDAKVVSKRMDVSHHTHNHGNDTGVHHSTSSWYYATFEVESGDRMELLIGAQEYGMLVEGDFGRLTFQGTRYKSFQRSR